MSGLMDSRRPPFCYQTVSVMAVIRDRFDGEERRTAVALYQAMTEVANECRRSGGRDGFEAPRPRIAEYAGCTVRTLDKYAEIFVELGILEVKRRKKGKLNLPNIWSLLDPATGPVEGSASDCATPRSETHHPGVANDTPGGVANNTPVQEVEEKKKNTPRRTAKGPSPAGTQNGVAALSKCIQCDGTHHIVDIETNTARRCTCHPSFGKAAA